MRGISLRLSFFVKNEVKRDRVSKRSVQHAFCPSRQLKRFFSVRKATNRIRELPVCESAYPKKIEKVYTYQQNSKKWTKTLVCDEQVNEEKNIVEVPFMGAIYHYTLKHFLPNGYPHSIQPEYNRFAIYSFFGNVASTASMVLSTQTLLLAIGVGQHAAAPISATLNWILKDGIGQFGGILFASKVSSSSNSIDADPKKWRMVSCLAMDCATFLELATLSFPGHFLLIASVANIGKNIAFLTASASRAKLHQFLALHENLADITGKTTSQSILASLVGTGLGIGLSPYLLGDAFSVLSGCLVLSSVHQICTFHSLKYVTIDRLNRQRLMILFDLYFKGLTSSKQHGTTSSINPREVCKHEAFFPLLNNCDGDGKWLHVGCEIEHLVQNGPEEMLELHQDQEKYILNCLSGDDNNELNAVFITFIEGALDEDKLRGLFHAYTVKAFIDDRIKLVGVNDFRHRSPTNVTIVESSYRYMNSHFPEFNERLVASEWKFGDGINIDLESENDVRIRLS